MSDCVKCAANEAHALALGPELSRLRQELEVAKQQLGSARTIYGDRELAETKVRMRELASHLAMHHMGCDGLEDAEVQLIASVLPPCPKDHSKLEWCEDCHGSGFSLEPGFR